jgi:hypothetical protein
MQSPKISFFLLFSRRSREKRRKKTGLGLPPQSHETVTLTPMGTIPQALLAHRQDMHAGACQPILVGCVVVFGEAENNDTPYPNGEREGTVFLHTPAGDPS